MQKALTNNTYSIHPNTIKYESNTNNMMLKYVESKSLSYLRWNRSSMVQEVNRQDLGAFGSTLRLEAVPSTEGRSKRMTRISLSLKLWVPHEGSAILLIMRLDKRFLVLQRLMFDIPTLDICSYEWGAAKVLLGFLVNMSESFCIHGAQALELQTKEISFETGLAH